MTYAIRVEGLCKRYEINRQAPNSSTLRDSLGRGIGRLLGRAPQEMIADHTLSLEPAEGDQPKEYWALKDVTFDVTEGERVGVIGANGAGKSTLLKILSRVTAPSKGRIEIRGKVASLLEVGTGFHPELSGRENVYLSGAILGMAKGEIRRKFDQIVAFSGVEKFIDTPVKFYSSGMYVRLAFSVSAWLDPDILIVDEVLAVGDQAFQKKCQERIKELTREGRTVMFVSHSMGTVNQMCQKVLYLENGRVMSYGPVAEGTVEYHRDVLEQIETQEMELAELELVDEGVSDDDRGSGQTAAMPTAKESATRRKKWRWHRPEFTLPDPKIEVMSDHLGVVEALDGSIATAEGLCAPKLPINQDLHIRFRYKINEDIGKELVASLNFYDEFGTILLVAMAEKSSLSHAGIYTSTCTVPAFLLNEGRFTVNFNLSDFTDDQGLYLGILSGLRFEIEEPDGVDVRRHGFILPFPGFFRHRLDWDLEIDDRMQIKGPVSSLSVAASIDTA